MAQYPTTVATLPSLSIQNTFGTTLVNAWVTEMIAVQRDYVSTIGAFSSLASYFGVIRDATGKFKIGQINHSVVISSLASQHHNKTHGSAHITSDAIRPCKDGAAFYPGLLTKIQFNKITSLGITNVNTGHHKGSLFYTGNGVTAGQTITIGFTPKYLSIWRSNSSQFEPCFQFYNLGWTYTIEEDLVHLDISNTTLCIFVTNGFTVKSHVNHNAGQYSYFAMGQPT